MFRAVEGNLVTPVAKQPTAPRGLRMRRSPGFSLLEMVAVTVIVGILALIAAPRFSRFSAQQRLTAAANRVLADLRLAQRHARFSSAPVTVDFVLAGHRYQLLSMFDPDHPSSPYIVHLARPPYDVTIAAANFGGDASITYDGFGSPDSNGSITLSAGPLQRTLTVDGPSIVLGEPAVPEIE